MKFKELVRKTIKEHGFEKIANRVVEIYPDEKENFEGHVAVLGKLLTLKPTPITDELYQGMEIVITHVVEDWKDPELTDDEYEDVHGCNGKTRAETSPDIEACKDCHFEECWALDFTPWSEWLGMPIREQTLKDYSELDIMAHCLWEVSWMGFTEDTIQEKKDDIDARVKSIKDGTAELIPWEEVKKHLEEKCDIDLDKEENE